ncbi:MAG: trehalose-phosphatase [Aquificota bacterium]|nr:trehalose-phosphatase [Aquificota bacterium]
MIIFLDYDGTLVSIREFPYLAVIDPERKKLIESLARRHKAVIITGRDKRSFSRVFGKVPEDIYLVTSHGARVYRGEQLIEDHLKAEMPDLTPLRERLAGLPGTFLEEKEGCFALHYRSFKGNEEEVIRIFDEFVSGNPPLKVIKGKKVLEAVYGEFDKGKGVETALKVLSWDGKEKVLYIGDDTTDIDAFKKVREIGGTALYVGFPPPPEADGFLRDVEEVYRFLSYLE